MKLVEINWNPQDRQLRQFGVICIVALPLLAWLWIGDSVQVLAISTGVGVAIAVTGVLYARALKPLFLGLTIVAVPIGMIVGELAMLLIYFSLFVPIGLMFRILRRDGLRRRIDRDSESYWSPKKQPKGPASYYRQS